MIMKGLTSMGATTAWVGCPSETRIASSVLTWPRVMSLSLYIWADTGSKPIEGPPVRMVSSDPGVLALSDQRPLTRLRSVSTSGLGPSRW